MMTVKISAVVNTYNEEKNLARCLESVKDFADEIVVVDMHSNDRTEEIARRYGAKLYQHKYTRYVEPARNFALQQAQGDWIFLIDADEELPKSLAERLKEVTKTNEVDYVEIPRKNIIFGKWIEHSRWWPDYLVRFFRKGKVRFSDKIHVPPTVQGNGLTLEAKEGNAILHYNFQTISQYIERLNRYSDIQADEIVRLGTKFNGKDLIIKPSNEFFSRFFVGEGFKDGLHGLVLALLQSFSELVVCLKTWEKEDFPPDQLKNGTDLFQKTLRDFCYWQGRTSSNLFDKIRFKIKSKI